MNEQQRRLAEELLFSGDKKKPSFSKQLFFGIFDASRVMPFPQQIDEDQERAHLLLTQLAEFVDKQIDSDQIDRTGNIPDAVIKFLGQSGVMGMTVPKEYGGLGLTQTTFCKAVQLISAKCASTALFVNVHQSIGLRALLIFGTDEQKAKWLPPLAKGEKFAAFSLTEANAGSDASAVETRAVYDPEKKVYILNGSKQWTTNGSIAHVLTVMARTEIDTPKGKQDKITAFLVTPDLPGFTVVNPSLEKVGYRGTKTANLAFHNMEVPAENVLGPLGGGLRVCLTVLDYGRTAFGATCTGAAKFLVSHAIHHACHRYQFNRPLASFGLVKQKIATSSALVYAMNATTFLTAGLIDAGEEDIMLEAAMLKVFASDSLWSILYDTMQIYGGRSFFTDHPFERMMRDARLNMIGEGSNEVMRAFIGAVGMRDVGMELKIVLDSLKMPFTSSNSKTLWDFFRRAGKRWKASTVSVKSPQLQTEAINLSKSIRKFGVAIVRALAKYREGIVEEQLLLDRLATSAIAIYTFTAVLSKLDSDLIRANGNQQALGNDITVAKLYCQLASDQIDRCFSKLFDLNDSKIIAVSDQITANLFSSNQSHPLT